MGEPRSQKQQREQLVRSLRAEGKSRVEVAEALRQRYRFNARIALRYAHEWSQRQAADEWNQRWPDELKTDRGHVRPLRRFVLDNSDHPHHTRPCPRGLGAFLR